MSRYAFVFFGIVVLIGAVLLPAGSQPPVARQQPDQPRTRPLEDAAAVIKVLNQPIDTKGLHEKVKLKVALDAVIDRTNFKLPIIVNKEGIAAILGADAPDPLEEDVVLPRDPEMMPVGMVLRLLTAQVGRNGATYVVRRGCVEIVPIEHTNSSYVLGMPVFASFEKRPVSEVLSELSEQTGLTITLDRRVGDPAKTPITATFRGTTLEDILVAVTEQADLKFAVLSTSIIVSTPDNAYLITQEEKRREKTREMQPSYPGRAKRLDAAAS